MKREKLKISWNINCTGCCLDYLLHNCHYTLIFDPNSLGVTFQDNQDYTHAFLRDSESKNPKHGQLATRPDNNIGEETQSLVQNGFNFSNLFFITLTLIFFFIGHTYTVYGTGKPLSFGHVAKIRLESVAIPFLKKEDMELVKLNFCNAAVLEMSMEESFYGRCHLKLTKSQYEKEKNEQEEKRKEKKNKKKKKKNQVQ